MSTPVLSRPVVSGLDAYRRDVAAIGRQRLGGDDADWLQLTELLDRAARARRRLGRAPHRSGTQGVAAPHDDIPRTGDAPAPFPVDPTHAYTAATEALRSALGGALAPVAGGPGRSPDTAIDGVDDRPPNETALLHAVAARAERMEEAGALALAAWVLGSASEALRDADGAAHAFASMLRARVARKRGDLVYADDLYASAIRLGRASHSPAVVAQATLGRGVVARMRGDYPSARHAFTAGVRLARRAGRRDLESAGHQGLLAAAATAKDFATALAHGWAALALARGNAEAEADALGNMAAIAGDLGDHRAAVRGYLAAATRNRSPRVRLPAIAGAAVSAGALGDEPLVRRLEAMVSQDFASAQWPYEAATGCALLARAWRHLGDVDRATAYERRARDLAEGHGFHELSVTLEGDPALARDGDIPRGAGSPIAPVDRRSAGILKQLARVPLEPEWALDAALVTR